MTLKARIVVAFLAIGVLLLASGYVILGLERSTLVRQFDSQLLVLRQHAKAAVTKAGSAAAAKSRRQLDGFFVGVRQSDGSFRVVVPIASEPALRPLISDTRKYSKPTTVAVTGASGQEMRVVAVTSRDGTVIIVGHTLAFVSAASSGLLRDLVLIGLVLMLLLGLIFWWIVRLGLAPIAAVTAAARSIKRGDVTQRAPDFPQGTEAHDLADAFNVLVETNLHSQATLRQFVADASHELRTPLATLTGYTSLYSQGGLNEPGAVGDAMSRIRQEALRMTRLVDDLLMLAKADQGPTHHLAPFDLVPVVRGVVSDLEVLETTRTLTTDTPSHARVVADQDQITQALMIFLDNARKYTPPGTEIEVRVEGLDDRMRLSVSDHGPGLEPDELDHVFDRFYRTAAGRAKVGSGAGLGLAIAHTLVTANGGAIGAASTVGMGSQFWMDLVPAK